MLNVYQICHGVGGSVENGLCWAFFVERGVKVNGNLGKYYRDVLLSQQMLPAIRHACGRQFLPSARQHTCASGA